jgi:hypothetical protein
MTEANDPVDWTGQKRSVSLALQGGEASPHRSVAGNQRFAAALPAVRRRYNFPRMIEYRI